MTPASGVLPVDKPPSISSHDAVAAVRRALGTRQVGHTGTLDPFATGLLLVCVRAATRLAEYLVGLPKTYRAVLVLGSSTDTDDPTGTVIRTSDAWRTLDEGSVGAALASQVGTIQQLPPTYSAKKVAGERMYRAARRGELTERAPVPVTVHRIDMLRIQLPRVEFEVECSKGTYIRAIARDVGDALGVGGHLAELRRTRVGRFRVEDAVACDLLHDVTAVERAWIDPGAAVSHLPRIDLNEHEATTVRCGARVSVAGQLPESVPVAMHGPDGTLLGIGERTADLLQPRKVLA